jgi:hypothetical protein
MNKKQRNRKLLHKITEIVSLIDRYSTTKTLSIKKH